ncbi:MAG: HEAT repeat domain-containing protein [Gemmataceae bacterium]
MNPLFLWRRKWLLIGLLLVGGTLAVGGWQYQALRAWYTVYRLAHADPENNAIWAERVASLDQAAVPRLLSCLRDERSQVCINVRTAFVSLIDAWGPTDPRVAELAAELARIFPRLSQPGQQSTLEIQSHLVEQSGVQDATLRSASQIVAATCRLSDPILRAKALRLAEQLTQVTERDEVRRACRELTQICLRAEDVDCRLHALHLAMQPRLAMLEQVVPLLNDPVPLVRQAAILAVGPAPEVMRTEELLHWLHDADPEVRRLCEAALRLKRGLREEHLKRGRLLTDPQPLRRLQVLEGLFQSDDLEPGIWLRHLSHDAEPAVRAAALRAAAEQTIVDLTDRMEQMARNDPSPTIRQMACYYLSIRKQPAPYSRVHFTSSSRE